MRKINFFVVFMWVVILLPFLSFPVMGMRAQAKQDLVDSIMNHPDVQRTGSGGYRVVVEENISGTKYKWRYDLRMIETDGEHLAIAHREIQDSGNVPDSEWTIEYIFVDRWMDGTLDHFDKDRFLSVSCNGGNSWSIVRPFWSDNFNYPEDKTISEEKQKELYEDELKYWKNKLQQ